MPQGSDSRRSTVLYTGTVQGVGFRYTVVRVAGGFAVTGDVRNLPDGRVELRAEGTPDERRRFLAAVEEAMAGFIRDRRLTESPATGQFDGFAVAY